MRTWIKNLIFKKKIPIFSKVTKNILKKAFSHGLFLSSEKTTTLHEPVLKDIFGDISCMSIWTFLFEKHKGNSQNCFSQSTQVPFEN